AVLTSKDLCVLLIRTGQTVVAVFTAYDPAE
ncbi:Hok/Gef family protein, partial [Escherichia coli]